MTNANACNHCGAPVAHDSPFCLYCGSRTQVQLNAPRDFYRLEQGKAIACPCCQSPLAIMPLDGNDGLAKGVCEACNSTLYPPGTLEIELNHHSKPAQYHDRARQEILQKKLALQNKTKDKALHCPICQHPMGALPYSEWFALKINRCNQHGFWVEKKRFVLLQQWREAGGHLSSPPLSAEVQAKEVEFGSQKLIIRIFVCLAVLLMIWQTFNRTASALQSKYQLCGTLFDEEYTGANRPDYALLRAREAQDCVLDNSNWVEKLVIYYRKRIPLEHLPHAPCDYVGVWESVRSSKGTTYQVTLKGNGEFIAFPMDPNLPPANPMMDAQQLEKLFDANQQATRGFWGEHEQRLIWLYQGESHPPDINPISKKTIAGFTLTEQDGSTQTRFTRLQELDAAGQKGCRR